MGDRDQTPDATSGREQAGVPAPPSVLPEVWATRDPRTPEHRQITIMFSDLVGSTALANILDAEDLAEIYRSYRGCISASIGRWGGHIARYYGDGALLYFGWPTARENDSERAVRVGLDIVASVGRLQAGASRNPLSARVGVATGMVMIGELIGEGYAQEESVVGPIPNLAARLQSLADPGTVLIAASTYSLVSELFECTACGRVTLKGFPEDIEVWQPRRAIEIARFQTRLSQRLTPLAGREREIDVLHDLWKKAAGGAGCGVVIAGDAGIGKSRLVHALRERLARVPHTELQWQCSPFHVDSALRPAIQAMLGPAGIVADDAPEVQQRKAEALFAALGFDREAIAAEIGTLFRSVGDGDRPAMAAAVKLHQVIELVAQFAFRLAGPDPLLMVVEDVHWADPSTLAAIDRILAGIGAHGILLVLTVRHEADMPQRRWADAARIELAGVGVASTRLMVSQIARGKDLPNDILDAIVARTGGVPLFIEEMTRMLLASGQLREERGRDVPRDRMLDLAIPAKLRDLLVARLDTLVSDKPIAQIAATIGRPFSSALLGRLVDEPEQMLSDALTRLCEARILERREGGPAPLYAFRHGLLQKAAYQSQLKSRLRELHARIARVLEEHFLDEVQTGPDFLAYHFTKAEMPEPAARHFLAAGRNALRLAATREAIASLEKGLAALATLPQSSSRDLLELRLQATLGTALMMSKSWAASEAEAALGAANALSHAATDPREVIWILWGVFVYHQVRGNIPEATTVAGRIRAAARPSHAESLLVAEMISIQISFYSGRFGDALAHCAGFAVHFDPQVHRALVNFYTIDLELVAKVHQAVAEWVLGRPGHALALTMQAEELARSTEHPYSIAWMLTWGSMVHLLREDLDALKCRVDEGIAMADLHGFSYMGALGRMMRGWCIGRDGRPHDGIVELQEGIAAFLATGAEIVIPYFRILHAELLASVGRRAAALDELAAAQTQIEARGESWALAELCRVRGDILAHGSADERRGARPCYRQAFTIAREQGACGWLSRVRTSLANNLSAIRAGVLSG